jgi:hypothetical protein
LTDRGYGPQANDFLVAAITSQLEDPLCIPLMSENLLEGKLRVASYVRPTYLYAANIEIMGAVIGRVTPEYLKQIVESIKRLLDAGS